MPNELKGEFVSSGLSSKGELVYGLTNAGVLICFELTTGEVRKHTEV